MPRIEFLIYPHLFEQVPRPYPASRAVSDWLKQMPMDREGVPTLKRCPPFLEAMTAGYIIPCPCDVTFEVSADAKLTWQSPMKVVALHFASQIEGTPFGNQAIIKFVNPWLVRTPPGYATLWVPPLNRFDMPFIPLSGIVETETYYREVHLPMISIMKPGQTHVMRRGSPLAQVIPIKREAWTSESRPLDAAERAREDQLFENVPHAYKEAKWRKLEYD